MEFKKNTILTLPILIFVIVISVNFFKPFGFFRESNPAMVGINYTYWNNFPSIREKRIPIESYNFQPGANPETQMWFTVTSFGYAWFLVPYSFFTIFNVEANALSIRVFSLFWLGFTLIAVYFLACTFSKINRESSLVVYLTLVFYLFNSAVLWYHVQGYVHEIAVLPFYFLSWLFFINFLQTTQFRWLIALALCLFVSVQFDWLPCFQACIMSIFILRSRKSIRPGFAFIVPIVSIALGIAWIIYTYSEWATLPVYLEFLKEKFFTRTIGNGGLQINSRINYNFNILIFYLTGFGLLCFLSVWGLLKRRNPEVLWLIIFTAIFHHLVFWGFSTEHDHAVIKMAFPTAFLSASVVAGFSRTKQILATSLVMLLNIVIYFYLHNFYVRKGMYANPDFCYEVGVYIKKNIKENDTPVFINTQGKYLLQIEFYAGRPYIEVRSFEEAQEILRAKYPGKVGYFIDGEKEGVKQVETLK